MGIVIHGCCKSLDAKIAIISGLILLMIGLLSIFIWWSYREIFMLIPIGIGIFGFISGLFSYRASESIKEEDVRKMILKKFLEKYRKKVKRKRKKQ